MKKKKPKAPKLSTALKRTPSTRANTSLTESSSKWIRIERPIVLEAYVRDAAKRLEEAGHVAYVVGGSVRDHFLKREAKDHDIATDARPDELCELFPKAIQVGREFGVIKVPLTYNESPVAEFLEIATFREDLEYQDHRHPSGIRFTGVIEDARRRDFTINALYYDIKSARVLDAVGGLEDLKARVIRAIGDPQERFKEDALRLLRAVRFATSLGFSIEASTEKAIRSRARLIDRVSAERVHAELDLMLSGPSPVRAIELLHDFGLLGYVLPEAERLRRLGNAWKQTLKLIDVLVRQNPIRPVTLLWAALLLRIGQPLASQKSGGKQLIGYELESARLIEKIGERLRFPTVEISQVRSIVEAQPKFREVFQMREATLQRFVRQPDFELMLALHRADATVTDGNLAFYDFCRTRLLESRRSSFSDPRLLSGEDLIQLGFKPGPHFSEILRAVEDLALESRLTSKQEALEYVVRHFVR